MEKWDIVKHKDNPVMLLERLEKPSGMFWRASVLNHVAKKPQIFPESELQPTVAEYQIPVIWENFGTVAVTASSMKEAIEIFDRDIDEFSLPDNEQYVEDSFHRDQYDTAEETIPLYALCTLYP